MMKKYFTLLFMLFKAYSYAQLPAFTVTATKINDETCPSNGAISCNPAPGMMAYDTKTNQLAVFNGTVWTFWRP